MDAATPIREDVDQDQPTDLEREREDSAEITQPFNPEKIKVRTVPILVQQIVARIKHGDLDLAPDFQRHAGIWDAQRRSRLIESLLLRIPIPVFYVAADQDDVWSVVDGVQRTSTIYDYVTGKFPLNRLEYLTHLNGKRHNDLPWPMQRRISETQFVFHVIEPGTPQEVMFNIFLRLNTGGKPLNKQEIRHALHPGPIRDYLRDLAESKAFRTATDGTISTKRMEDRELVLRFLAFYIAPWENYSSNDLDAYLGNTMEKVNKMDSDERAALKEEFEKAMLTASKIFHNDAFRKRYRRGDGRYPISRALFESWAIGLARRSRAELSRLEHRRDAIINGFIRLLNEDSDFENAISYATGTPHRVRKRFEAIDTLIKRFL